MTTSKIVLPALMFLAAASQASADAPAPPPPPENVWFGKGQFGFLDSSGNSEAEAVNANLDMSLIEGPWKHEATLTGLYGKNSGITAAERWVAGWQTNYAITQDLFGFGSLRYEHDLFDGFQYQGAALSAWATSSSTPRQPSSRCRPASDTAVCAPRNW